MVQEKIKIEKIQLVYTREEADKIISALQNTFNIVKDFDSKLKEPTILLELIEDLAWNNIDNQ